LFVLGAVVDEDVHEEEAVFEHSKEELIGTG